MNGLVNELVDDFIHPILGYRIIRQNKRYSRWIYSEREKMKLRSYARNPEMTLSECKQAAIDLIINR